MLRMYIGIEEYDDNQHMIGRHSLGVTGLPRVVRQIAQSLATADDPIPTNLRDAASRLVKQIDSEDTYFVPRHN